MGWFGFGPMDGDDGMDLRDEVFHMIGVEYDEKYNCLTSNEEISELLDKNQDMLYDWIRDYDWDNRYNPGFIQEVYIQALMQVMLDYEVKISDRGKKGAIPFIKNDHWAKENKERKEEMDKLYKLVEDN